MKKAPMHMEINGVTGIALQPYAQPWPTFYEIAQGHRNAMFVDLAFTLDMRAAVKGLMKKGTYVIAYRDHHYDPHSPHPADLEMKTRVQAFVEEMPPGEARFGARREHPSCSKLVEHDEAARKKISLVVHHADADGFYAYLKAAGVSYPGMDHDADIMDGHGDLLELTPQGKLFRDAMAGARKNGISLLQARQQTQREFADYLQSGFSKDKEEPLRLKAQNVETIAQKTEALAKSARVLQSGLAYVECPKDEPFDTHLLLERMREHTGAVVTAVKHYSGALALKWGAVISVSRPPAMRLDLRRFLPPQHFGDRQAGIMSNTPFLIHFSEDHFGEFNSRFHLRKI